MTEIAQHQPTDLTAVAELPDAQLFTVPMLAHALDLLTERAAGLVADASVPEGRKQINKTSRAVGGAIRRLDERRAKYVAELKKRPAEIDKLFRETFRKPAEQIQANIRAPLDAWNEDQRAAEEETTRLIDWLTSPVEAGTKAEEIERRLELTRELELPDWVSETQRDAITAAMQQAIPRLEQAHAAAAQAQAQAAELERLRQIERQAEIERAKQEAAERARAEAEAAAERRAEDAERRAAAELERAREEAATAAREEERQRQQRQAPAGERAERQQPAAPSAGAAQIGVEPAHLPEQTNSAAADRAAIERAVLHRTIPRITPVAIPEHCSICEHDLGACSDADACQLTGQALTSDPPNRADIHREIAADLEFAVEGLSLELANRIIAALERGAIPRLHIAYR